MNIEAMQGVMLAVASAQSTESVLRQIVEGIASCQSVVLARIWLLRSGETDRGVERWLELAASAGNFVRPGADPRNLTGRFKRFELGQGKVGRVALTGEGVHIESLEAGEAWVFDPDWTRAEGVVSFAAQPLIARGETLGVIAVFGRRTFPAADVAWLRTFADHAAVAITNARAFEEIQSLRVRLERENTYLREEVSSPFHDILGRSSALQRVLRQVEMVAPTEASVLVLGETGVGKELVARAVHAQSARRDGPLIRVNCGAVPGDLFESEFFGHVRGAFTGAVRDRVGRFELADGGTLFLDEVGEIPLGHQPKLLRVLQEGTFERVGDPRTRKANVRIVAATNRDLAGETARGRFRSDLYHRLSVFPIEVPPLRERREDVPELAAHFIQLAARRLNVRPPSLSAAQARALSAYDWPGNARELQHVIERALILGRGRDLELPELAPGPPAPGRAILIPTGEAKLPTLAQLRERERETIALALQRSGGKVSGPGGAAELLGVRPTTLDSKLRALGIRERGPGGRRQRG